MSATPTSSTQRKRSMRLHLKCPNCRGPVWSRKVISLNYSLTELLCECQNELCKMAFVAYVDAKRILQPPRNLINHSMTSMELSRLARNQQMQEFLNRLPVSDDDTDFDLLNEVPQDDLFAIKEANDSA